MKFTSFIKDKIWETIIFLGAYAIILLFLFAYKIPNALIITISTIYLITSLLLILIDYFRKRSFYNQFEENIKLLDKKYLILETLPKPNFYEGKLLVQNLYEIDKSMLENVTNYEQDVEDFKEYIEMWIHEVKIPIASLTLMCHNHKEKLNKSYLEQLRRLDNLIDQVLYYVRSNYTEKDFIIKETALDKLISEVALKNKDNFLENKIDLFVNVEKTKVNTDAKWLEFILGQLINNSIKYKKDIQGSYIKIFVTQEQNLTVLHIQDNGIGIPKSDLPQVFNKTFTGTNGHSKTSSTGMGLYIAKKLCKKLGHKIEADSKVGEYTEITITFDNNDFYKPQN